MTLFEGVTQTMFFLVAALISWKSAGFLRVWALSRKIVDYPDQRRKHHSRPTPLLGGLAIAGAFVITLLLGIAVVFLYPSQAAFADLVSAHRPGVLASLPRLGLIVGGGIAALLVGLRDDVKPLSAGWKLAAQCVIALVVVSGGVRISLFMSLPAVRAFVTIAWIVALMNAFNLMDNMDGLSCGTAIICALFFFAITALSGQVFIATLLACFLGAMAGFLPYNLPPARMFMGDAGSLFNGFMLSVLTVISTYYSPAIPTPAPVIVPLVIMAIPLFDTASVVWIRWRRGKRVFDSDTNHLSHRLVRLGMTRGQAVLFICVLNCCIGLSATLLLILPAGACAIVLAQSVLILSIPVFLERIAICH